MGNWRTELETYGHGSTKDLNPVFGCRIVAGLRLYQDRHGARPKFVSGVRSYEKQKQLYARYRAGKGNTAANPDRKRSDGRVGSNHMQQPGHIADVKLADGTTYEYRDFGHAVDLSTKHLGSNAWRDLDACMVEYGTILTVGAKRDSSGLTIGPSGRGQFENWHREINRHYRPDLFKTFALADVMLTGMPGIHAGMDAAQKIVQFKKISMAVWNKRYPGQKRDMSGRIDAREWPVITDTVQFLARL